LTSNKIGLHFREKEGFGREISIIPAIVATSRRLHVKNRYHVKGEIHFAKRNVRALNKRALKRQIKVFSRRHVKIYARVQEQEELHRISFNLMDAKDT